MIAIVVENVYALLTLASVYAKMPDVDPYVIYIGAPQPAVEEYLREHGHDPKRTGILPSYELRTLHIALRDLGSPEEYVLALRGGLLVLKDPRPTYPDAERMAPYSTGVACKYVYSRHMLHHKSYRALRIDVRDNQNNRVTFHRLAVPFDDTKFLTLAPTISFCYDPLLKGFMSGREIMMHSKRGCEASVIDFLPQLLNPALRMKEAYGCPLEFYLEYVEALADRLPSHDLPVIRKNGKRSAFIAPVRALIHS